MMMFMRKKDEGFTLIEVMLVVIIIGIISIIALPKLLVTRDTARDNSCDSNRQAIKVAIEQYKWEVGSFPSALTPATLITELMGTVTSGTETFGPWLPADSQVSNDCPDPDGDYTYDNTTGSFTCDIH